MFEIDDLVAHMRPVLAAERDLRDLAVVWQMVESSAAIGCPDEAGAILETLVDTRRRFDDLQSVLIQQMALQNSAELGDDLNAKAQCAIDILVRNLYERTADVGFLATDDTVRAFCAAPTEQRLATQAAMVRRLAEYQAKYSVYDDVILLSTQGEVLARLDAGAGLAASADPLVADALAARSYVERFGPSDLAARDQPALLYAQAIHAPDGRALGVLVLRFRFADEMKRIFDGVVNDPARMVVTLIDPQGVVIASSDAAHLSVGARLHAQDPARLSLNTFAGREYLASCCASSGYQGYVGPGWRAVAMVSLLTAFRHRRDDADADVPLDNAELIAVQAEADAINRDLRRVLWNGRLLIGGDGSAPNQNGQASRLKAVLRQVALTGARTRTRVTRAIHDIYGVALARSRHQCHELARLAADVMDRNLYERANDCRWWALSPALQQRLAEPASPANTQALQAVLAHINSLYTVYSQLVLFDAQGQVRALSAPEAAAQEAGSSVPQAWLQQLQSLSTSQDYAVTPFEPTDFHAQGATYVYLAALRTETGQALLGGVAIVFNSARELGAMLRDILGERQGVAAFVDASGRVLAATDDALAVGVANAFTGEAGVVEHAGVHYACARVRACGYREFKASDRYDNGVHAVVGLRLGASERRRQNFSQLDLNSAAAAGAAAVQTELAVFQVAAMRYALPVAALLEAVEPGALVRTPSTREAALGMAAVDTPQGSRLVQVLCARQLLGVAYPAREHDGVLLVLRPPPGHTDPQALVALRVDDVLSVLEVSPAQVHPAPPELRQYATWVDALVDCEVSGAGRVDRVLIQRLSHDQLWRELTDPAPTAHPVDPADEAQDAAVADLVD